MFEPEFDYILGQVYQSNPTMRMDRDRQVDSGSMPLYSAIEVLSTAKRLDNMHPDLQIGQLCNEVQPCLMGLAQRFITNWKTDHRLRRQLLTYGSDWNRGDQTKIFWRTFLSQKLLEGRITGYHLDALSVYIWLPYPLSFEWVEAVTQMCLYFPELNTLLDYGTKHPPGAVIYQAAPFEPFHYGFTTPSTRISNPTFIASMSAKYDQFDSPEWVHYKGDPYMIYGRYEVHRKGAHCFLLIRSIFQKQFKCYYPVTEQDAISVLEVLRRGSLGIPEHIQLLQLLQYAIRVTLESCLGMLPNERKSLQPLAFITSISQGQKGVRARGVSMVVVDFGCAITGGSGKFWIACTRPCQMDREIFEFTTLEDLKKQEVELVGLP